MDCTKLHFSFQNYWRQFFKPHRWKCDPLEANKETQQGITCVSFWEKVSVKEKTWFGQIKEKVMFWRKNQAKHIFLIKSKAKFLSFLTKTSWKRCVFLPKKHIENRVTRKFDESLAKVSLKLSVAIRKFQRNFRWNFRWPYESFMKLSLSIRKFHENLGANYFWIFLLSWVGFLFIWLFPKHRISTGEV